MHFILTLPSTGCELFLIDNLVCKKKKIYISCIQVTESLEELLNILANTSPQISPELSFYRKECQY